MGSGQVVQGLGTAGRARAVTSRQRGALEGCGHRRGTRVGCSLAPSGGRRGEDRPWGQGWKQIRVEVMALDQGM